MKKSLFTVVLVVFSMGIAVQSCKDKVEDNSDMKESTEAKTEPALEANNEDKDPQKVIIQNMHDAYKGETTAHFKYAAYSKKAIEEGHPEVALLFKAASGAELIHANNHKVVLLRMGETIPEITPEFTVNSTLEKS